MTVFDDLGEGVQKSWDKFVGVYDKPVGILIIVFLGLWTLFLVGLIFLSNSPWIAFFLLLLTAGGIVTSMYFHGTNLGTTAPPTTQLPMGTPPA